MLAFDGEGEPVALVPGRRGGYRRIDARGSVRVTRATAADLAEGALCFYRPLPQRALATTDLLRFMTQSVDAADWLALVAASAAVAALGLVAPRVSEVVFGPVLESGDPGVVGPVAALLAGALIAQVLVGGVRQIVLARVATKVDVTLGAAVMMRVLSLPASFFSHWDTGELAGRVEAVSDLAALLRDAVLTVGLSALFSLAYVGQIASMAPSLLAPSAAALALSAAVSLVVSLAQAGCARRRLEVGARLSGRQLALFEGVQKIRLAGAEKRAFATWSDLYRREARLAYNGPLVVRLSGTLQLTVSLAGSLAIYASALSGGVDVASFMGFSVAYGAVSGSFASLGQAAERLGAVGPYLGLVRPVLEAVPEVGEGRPAVGRLSGALELSGVTFAYDGSSSPVLRDLSLRVRPGEYVAVVGRTGCGKSTLVRLLLGFERPQRGAVYYDVRDLAAVDARSVRAHIGVVLQDGRLFQGSIYDNIAVGTPGLSLDDAWAAAEMAGVARDISAMPMGMRTMLSDGGGGVSGGQRQRILIARAIAARPKILIFDEATSALDNVSQKVVSDSLDALGCTRLVVAHRLSTIRNCDRVVVIDEGRVVEDGTYDELLAKGGLFAELVERQRV